jgi:hypothetical protein
LSLISAVFLILAAAPGAWAVEVIFHANGPPGALTVLLLALIPVPAAAPLIWPRQTAGAAVIKRRHGISERLIVLLLLALGAAEAMYWYLAHGYVGLGLSVCYAPGALAAAMGFWTEGTDARAWNNRTAGAVLGLCIALLTTLGFVAFSYGSPVLRVANYERLLAQSARRGGRGHLSTSCLPRRIPPTAKHVRLYFMKGWVGTELQIRYQGPPSEVAAVLANFTPKALAVYKGSSSQLEHFNEPKGYATAEFRNPQNTGTAPLPPDFKVMVLDSLPNGPNTWSHNHSSGVAVSRKSNEIIYWADSW